MWFRKPVTNLQSLSGVRQLLCIGCELKIFFERGTSLSNFNALGAALQPSSGLSPAGPTSFLCWVGCHNSGVEGQKYPCAAGHIGYTQETFAFLGCKCTLSAPVELLVHQYPQVLLLRASTFSEPWVGPCWSYPSPHPSLPRSLRMASLPCSVNYTIQIGAICTHHGLRKGQQAEENEHFRKKMEFWKSINGADQVFHQTSNLAIFCDTFKKISPVVKQKPVLAICRGIYIPADWHKVRTEMLKHRVIFTTAGLLNFSSFPKTLLGPPWMPGADFCWLWTTGWVEEVAPIFFKLLFQIYLRNECKEGGSQILIQEKTNNFL